MHLRKTVLISALAFCIPTVSAFRKLPIAVIMSKDQSSVLGELKDTIQKQKEEIKNLKKQLNSGRKPAAVGHGHGGGGEESPDELAAYLRRSPFQIATRRVGWLGLFLVSLSFTALIMNGFEHTLERQIELAYFVPLLAGHGGNTGGQAVGTVLSSLSAGFIKLKDAPRVVAKEAMSGLIAGTFLGAAVGVIAHYVMHITFHVSMVVASTIPLVSLIAGTLGSSIPFLCVLFGQDPSVIAAPAMTSFVDVSGLMAYFIIAQHIFAYYGIEL